MRRPELVWAVFHAKCTKKVAKHAENVNYLNQHFAFPCLSGEAGLRFLLCELCVKQFTGNQWNKHTDWLQIHCICSNSLRMKFKFYREEAGIFGCKTKFSFFKIYPSSSLPSTLTEKWNPYIK